MPHGVRDRPYERQAYQLEPAQRDQFGGNGFKGICTSRDPAFTKFIEVIVRFGKPGEFPNYIIPVRPDAFETRITLQHGCFTFHPPSHPVLTEKHNPTLTSVIVHAGDKAAIRHDLEALGINRFSVYGDLDNLGKTLTSAFEIKYPKK